MVTYVTGSNGLNCFPKSKYEFLLNVLQSLVYNWF